VFPVPPTSLGSSEFLATLLSQQRPHVLLSNLARLSFPAGFRLLEQHPAGLAWVHRVHPEDNNGEAVPAASLVLTGGKALPSGPAGPRVVCVPYLHGMGDATADGGEPSAVLGQVREAIAWALEFSDQLGFDRARIKVSVFGGDDQVPVDDEAIAIWKTHGFSDDDIVRLGRGDNFWGPAGATGPCGPCSELYYDMGEEFGCGQPDCGPGCECDRWMEYWNLVFVQYEMDADGGLSPLAAQAAHRTRPIPASALHRERAYIGRYWPTLWESRCPRLRYHLL